MPKRADGVKLRGSVYWMRVRVPDKLRDAFGTTEFHKSLRTSDYREAKEKAQLERALLNARWRGLRGEKPITQPVDDLSDSEIFELIKPNFIAKLKFYLGPGDDRSADLDELREEYYSSFHEDDSAGDLQDMKKIMAEAGIDLPVESPLGLRFLHWLHRASVEARGRALRAAIPGAVELDPAFASLTMHSPVQRVARITLKKLIEEFTSEAGQAPLSGKTVDKRASHWRVIKEFFGAGIGVATIDRSKVKEFCELLAVLPANASKRFPKRSLREAVELGKARSLPPMDHKTANDILGSFGRLMRHALAEGYVNKDPSLGVKVAPRTRSRKAARSPFSVADLKLIFQAPLYTGCVDDVHGYAKPGPNHPRRGRFWVPLIALYSGMRLNEICQLTLDDFAVDGDANVIHIRSTEDGTKQVKTRSGERFVPVHPELIKIGLLAHVKALRNAFASDAPVFPELSAGSTGYKSDAFSKWFARFLTKVGVDADDKVFHSFRHTYRDALREAGISVEKARALGGWAGNGEEAHYGGGLSAKTLAKDIEAVTYPGLDLSHLHVKEAALPQKRVRQIAVVKLR